MASRYCSRFRSTPKLVAPSECLSMDGRCAKSVPRWQRRLALACALALVVCVLGCMSFDFGRVETVQPTDANVQTGSVTVPPHQTLDVFYPSPYVVTPNL